MDSRVQVQGRQARPRSRNACDGCRARKVKCHYEASADICTACGELEVPCTRNKPRKKRGPVNQYALAIKEHDVGQTSVSPASTSLSAVTPGSAHAGQRSILDQIASLETISLIIDDWFNLIHSVCPIHHRANLFKRLSNGDTDGDPEFLAVIISMCAATVSSLPRKSAADYPEVTAQRCVDVISQNRLLDGGSVFTLQWCQAKYHLSTALLPEQGTGSALSFRYLGEATTGIKYLTFYELKALSPVENQLAKRLYWLIFSGLCTIDMYNRPTIGLFSPQDNVEALRPLGLNDFELDPANISPAQHWHGDSTSYVPGLNYLSDLFLCWYHSQQAPVPSLTHLQHHITLVRRTLDNLPPSLRWRGGLSRPPGSNFGTDVQTANLYITQLHIHFCLLEQMNTISKSQPASPLGASAEGTTNMIQATREDIRRERGTIARDLLEILYHTSEEVLESNGHSLIPKVRDIGSALLDELLMEEGQHPSDAMDTQSNNSGLKAREDLQRLLEKLERLDFKRWGA